MILWKKFFSILSLSLFAFPFSCFCEMQSRSYVATVLWQAADIRKVWNFLTILPRRLLVSMLPYNARWSYEKVSMLHTSHSNKKENSVYSINIGQDGLDNKIGKLKIEFVNWIDHYLRLFNLNIWWNYKKFDYVTFLLNQN